MTFALGAGPTVLIGYALYASRTDEVPLGNIHISALLFSLAIALLGPILYGLAKSRIRTADR